MLSRQLHSARISASRPLRPPKILSQKLNHRVFTHNAQLLLLVRHTPRPQLPYLSQPAFHRTTPVNGPSRHLARLLSTETRRYVREQTWLAFKWTAIAWTFLILGGMVWYGVRLETDERANPTPDEWSFTIRQSLRAARLRMSPQSVEKLGFVDWVKVGLDLKHALEQLEDTDKQGKGLLELAEGEGILIPGVGKAGFDISAKSWPWRAGYFEVIMGCGRSAEHLDAMVLDETRGIVFPREYMIGPSNPDPRPLPPAVQQAPPLEENCVKPYSPPETFYMRVLTGKGFTTKQRIDAALAYANWLEFKRLPESAEEMHRWALDIAAGSMPIGVDRESVVDMDSGVLRIGNDTQYVTPNLLRASTELAVHHARNGNVSSALPIFLSVLRARRDAPFFPLSSSDFPSAPESPLGKLFGKIFNPPKFPPPPPTGDDSLIRHSKQPTCDESELMLYIGEILFATSPASSEGVGWTRQAVTIAEANLQQEKQQGGPQLTDENRKCKQCLLTGVTNWDTMLQRIRDQSSATPQQQQKGWFSGWSPKTEYKGEPDLQEDLARVEQLKDRIVRDGIEEQLTRGRGVHPKGVWIG